MNPQYNLICVPLDPRSPAQSPNEFRLSVACELKFPEGIFTSAQLSEVLAHHPVLRSRGTLKARIKSFAAWRIDAAMTTADTFEVELSYQQQAHGSLSVLAKNLSDYMGNSSSSGSVGMDHDSAFDLLPFEHFVDIAKAYDDVVELKRMLQLYAMTGSPPGEYLDKFPLLPFRQMDSYAHAALLEGLFDEKRMDGFESLVSRGNAAETSAISKVKLIREALKKIEARLTIRSKPSGRPALAARGLQATGQGGNRTVPLDDLNVAVHSALRNGLLAASCGFVSNWVASFRSLNGDFVLQLDLSAFSPGATPVDVVTTPTAFRRGTHTHPLAFADTNGPDTSNCGFAALNDIYGDPRYRASCLNTEAQLIKDIIVQSQNSLSNLAEASEEFGSFTDRVDTRRPQLLREHQVGTSEPETSGIIFSAPVEDMATASGLKAATPDERRSMPASCLFLEDLWIGFRVDIAHGETSGFRSIHIQQQRIAFRRQGEVKGRNEDFYDREQADDKERGYSSTEFGTYNGMTTSQTRDFQILLGLEQPAEQRLGEPFRVFVEGYESATRLLFGQIYRYRLRNVLLGCISLAPEDMQQGAGNRYIQSIPFFRSKGFRPGELVSAYAGKEATPTNRLSIYLSDDISESKVTLVPTPIDIDTCRYYGIVLSHEHEDRSLDGRKFVRDAAKMFIDGQRSMNYFFDPEVAGVVVRARVLNGDAGRPDTEYAMHGGSYCEIVRHIELEPVRQAYGSKDNWRGFKPITITFRTTQINHPVIRKRGFLLDCHQIEVQVPPACEIELSIIADVEKSDLQRTSHFMSSSAQLYAASKSNTFASAFNPVPALTEQLIRVVNAVPIPLLTPRIMLNHRSSPARALRGLDQEFALIEGRIELDAASTGQVLLHAAWSDIDDNPQFPTYAVYRGQTKTATHSVVFAEEPQPTLSGMQFLRQLSQGITAHGAGPAQCAENKVFLAGANSDAGPIDEVPWHALNFKDYRRKVAIVEALVRSRFEKVYKERSLEVASNGVVIDVPSTQRLEPPRVSHILPLGKTTSRIDGPSGSVCTEYAFRIFLKRPWFTSGPGERLALGFVAAAEPNQIQESLDKTTTQWGEDPVERPSLVISRRPPRASDFVTPDTQIGFSEILYPNDEERVPLLYRDNIPVLSEDLKTEKRFSVASYAVVQDVEKGLWHCDVAIASEFFGWCGMALYRHQPGSCEHRELSNNSDWAYVGVLHGDPVAWFERGSFIHVTIGPCFDPYTQYELDSTEFRDGVSSNLNSEVQQPIAMRRFEVGDSYYFEAVGSSKERTWSVTKKRFDHGIASIPLFQ